MKRKLLLCAGLLMAVGAAVGVYLYKKSEEAEMEDCDYDLDEEELDFDEDLDEEDCKTEQPVVEEDVKEPTETTTP